MQNKFPLRRFLMSKDPRKIGIYPITQFPSKGVQLVNPAGTIVSVPEEWVEQYLLDGCTLVEIKDVKKEAAKVPVEKVKDPLPEEEVEEDLTKDDIDASDAISLAQTKILFKKYGFDVGADTVKQLAAEGKFRSAKDGRNWVISKSDLIVYLRKTRKKATQGS